MHKEESCNNKEKADFHLEIDSYKRILTVSISSVSSIIDVSEERVLVRSKERRVEIIGEGLAQ